MENTDKEMDQEQNAKSTQECTDQEEGSAAEKEECAADEPEGGETAAHQEAGDSEEIGQDDAEGGEELRASEGDSEHGGFLKKKKKEDKKDKQQQKIEELEDRVKRQMAEFENFRKRTEKEKSAMFEIGAKSVIEKILPVVDNFERGLAAVAPQDRESPFSEGMNMIYKQLIGELEKLEVKPIEAVGKEFNPDYHNAVMQVESEEYESGMIAQELQKGYTYRDSVLRHSMVAVVQ